MTLTCSRCDGHGKIKKQSPYGEVRIVMCSRCEGRGLEPVGFWERLKASFRVEEEL